MSSIQSARDELETSFHMFLSFKSTVSNTLESTTMANKERLKSLRLDFKKSLKDLNRSWTVWKCRYEEEFGTNAYNNEKYSASWLEGQWYEYSDLDDQLDEIVYSMLVNSISQYSGQMSFSLSTTGGFATSEVPVDATPVSVDSAATPDDSTVGISTFGDLLATSEGPVDATLASVDSAALPDDSAVVIPNFGRLFATSEGPGDATSVSVDSAATPDDSTVVISTFGDLFATSGGPVDATPASVDSAATPDDSAVVIPNFGDLFATSEGPVDATPASVDSAATPDDSAVVISTSGELFATSTPASVDSAATQDESAVNILTSDDSLMTFEGLGHATPALGESVVTTDDSTDVMLISNNPLTPVNAPLYKTLVSDDSISTAAGSAQFNFVSEGSPDGTSSGLISMWACSSEAFNWFVSALLRSATDIINSPRHFIPPSDVKLPMVLKPPAVFSSL